MKKNLISRKQKDFYYYYFLPFLEALFTIKKWRDEDLVINQSTVANYFKIDRRAVSDFLKQAEADGLIIFEGRVRKLEDKTLNNSVRKYVLPEASEYAPYYSKLQEFINNYVLWIPTFGERLEDFYNYTNAITTDKKSEQQLLKEQKANMYGEKYSWATKLLEQINAERPEKFRSSYLKEHKLRETNILCSTFNPEKEHVGVPEEALLYRYVLLAEFLGTADFTEFDTNGSIYRLSYAIHNQELLDHDVDVYEEIWKRTGLNARFNKLVRNCLKVLCMPIFMSNGTKNGYNSTLIFKEDNSLSKADLTKKTALKQLMNLTDSDGRTVLDSITEAMYLFLGTDEFLKEEIFIHESNLHILILNKCSELGINTINVYDGFYFAEGQMNQKLFDAIYDESTEQLLQKLK